MQARKLLPYLFTLLAGLALGYLFFAKTAAAPQTGLPLAAADCAPAGLAYTCAMHPQVQQERAGNCPFCNMRLALGRIGGNEHLLAMTPAAVQLANVRTEAVGGAGFYEKEILLNGKVLPDESRIYRQVIHLPGRIEKLYVNKTGEEIRAGQPIARIFFAGTHRHGGGPRTEPHIGERGALREEQPRRLENHPGTNQAPQCGGWGLPPGR